jgi:hypothetical protein
MPKRLIKGRSRDNGKAYVGALIQSTVKQKLERKAERGARTLAREIELALKQWTETEPL